VLLAQGERIGTGDLALAASDGGGLAPLEQMTLADAEGFLIRRALDRAGGNVSVAARALGLSRSALYRRLERLDL